MKTCNHNRGEYCIHDSFNVLMDYGVVLENIHTKCRYQIEEVTPSIITLVLYDECGLFFRPGKSLYFEYAPLLKLYWDYKKVRKHFIVWKGN